MSTSAADPILSVERLSMRFGGLVAIDELSFNAQRAKPKEKASS